MVPLSPDVEGFVVGFQLHVQKRRRHPQSEYLGGLEKLRLLKQLVVICSLRSHIRGQHYFFVVYDGIDEVRARRRGSFFNLHLDCAGGHQVNTNVKFWERRKYG